MHPKDLTEGAARKCDGSLICSQTEDGTIKGRELLQEISNVTSPKEDASSPQ
jgi:hypothetical protein